jgi:hypothetical protein
MDDLWSRIVSILIGAGLTLLAGCTNIGVATVPRDRFEYSSAIADSWKQQALLNIVKIRYTDLPVFVDVSSIVAGYSLQTGVSLGGVVSSEHAVQGNYGSMSAQGIYTDRPTITYVPMTGEKFLRGLVTPIDPKNIFFMLQSGYPADFILGLAVESLNGVRNRTSAGGVTREADPEFLRVMQLLREVQLAGVMGMRIEEDKSKGAIALLFFRGEDAGPEIAAKTAEIRSILRLSTQQDRLAIIYSPVRGSANELAVNSRSMLQILTAFASYVDVPESDLTAHRATPAVARPLKEGRTDGIRIRSGTEQPKDAYAAVRYRDHWFWVDDDNWLAKRALTSVMFLFTMAESGGPDQLPLITIPAQ